MKVDVSNSTNTYKRAFTIIELIIVITIMGILVTLGVVNLRGSQSNGRDAERKVDIETIATHLESYYTGGTDSASVLDYCTGGTITHDGLYTVHKFTTVGASTLTCPGNISAQVLVVGGGGGGGYGNNAGGGGGGGVVEITTMNISGSKTISVGDGGVGKYNTVGDGTNGGNSSFDTDIAIGGGSGSGNSSINGYSGGSGGGSGWNGTTYGTGGSSTQGNTTNGTGYGFAGQGGVAVGAGGGAGSNGAGGGLGRASSITGGSVTYARGGTYNGSAAGANTGNGCPANGGAGTGNGGSGIVIVRYLTPNNLGTYPSTLITANAAAMTAALRDIDTKSLTAPGMTDPTTPTQTFVPASNNVQTTAGVLPQPTKDQYVYQPLQTDGTLCTTAAQECRKFNLYYRSEVDDTVKMVTSTNQ